MIYTLTLNPAIDYVIELSSLNVGQINRSNRESIYFGGKRDKCILDFKGIRFY